MMIFYRYHSLWYKIPVKEQRIALIRDEKKHRSLCLDCRQNICVFARKFYNGKTMTNLLLKIHRVNNEIYAVKKT